MSEIYIVTHTEDYEIENQYAFTNKEDAEAKERELNEKLFSEAFSDSRDEFSEDQDVMDYQYSTQWWDDDCRAKVHFETVVLEIPCK